MRTKTDRRCKCGAPAKISCDFRRPALEPCDEVMCEACAVAAPMGTRGHAPGTWAQHLCPFHAAVVVGRHRKARSVQLDLFKRG